MIVRRRAREAGLAALFLAPSAAVEPTHSRPSGSHLPSFKRCVPVRRSTSANGVVVFVSGSKVAT